VANKGPVNTHVHQKLADETQAKADAITPKDYVEQADKQGLENLANQHREIAKTGKLDDNKR
jgi:hypothetical protein